MELEVLGLPAAADAVYRLLVGAETLSVAEIASALGTTVDDARVSLRVLEDRGLVSHRVDVEDHYLATRPSVGLGAMLAERQNQIRMAEVVVRRLEETTARRAPSGALPTSSTSSSARTPSGRAWSRSRRPLARRCWPWSRHRSRWSAARRTPPRTRPSTEASATGRCFERSMLQEEPRLYDEIVRIQERGEQMRLAASVPLKLFVVDRSLALVPLGPATAPVPGALLVHPSGLLDALVALFEAVWRDAVDVVPGPDGLAEESPHESMTGLDARILTLLLAGLTDQAVAGALGTSVRTVQRRVRFLMTAAGVETRMQLGWAASRLGWPVNGPGSGQARDDGRTPVTAVVIAWRSTSSR